MKLKYIALALLLAGCKSNSTTAPVPTKTDSLIIMSDSIAAKAEASSKALDSVATVTAEKVTDNVKVLNETIVNYETQIKTATKVKTVETIKTVHDTVYIETKKNFWGRTKKSVTVASDSSVNQTEVEVVDTTGGY